MGARERTENAAASRHKRHIGAIRWNTRSALAAASLGMLLNHCSQLDERSLNEASGGVGGLASGGTKADTSGGSPEGVSGASSGGAHGTGGSAVGNAGQGGNPDGGTTSLGGADPGGAGEVDSGGGTPTGGGDSKGGASATSGGSSAGGKGGSSSPGDSGGSSAGGSAGNSAGGKGGSSAGGSGGSSVGGSAGNSAGGKGGSSAGGKAGSGSGGATCSSDLTTDAMNCGVCGRVCASGSCVASVCQAVTYSLTYNGNGSLSGTIPVDSKKYQQGETVTVAANPGALARLGYVFAGWNTKSDGTGTNYASGSGTFQMGTVNATLYAKWIIRDASGNIYTDVTIGSQVWLVENLKTSKYNDGTTIAAVPDPCDGTGRLWAGDPIYGAYYNGDAVRTGRLAPAGWRVPTVNDWKTLVATTQNNAKAVASTLYWRSSTSTGAVGNDQSANNSTGFYGLPGGHYTATATNGTVGFEANWWTSNFYTDEGSYYGDYYFLAYDNSTIEPNGPAPACSSGLSVKLVRDY
jgi:uncharacterized protein (TIGR02145 family)/uncharacterized repeat protein (TIGR02543 family)